MIKRAIAVLAALLIPYLIFSLVISLNESDWETKDLEDKQVNFGVVKQAELQKPEPKEKPKPKNKEPQAPLPSIKPSDLGSSLLGGGLSFGIPQFDEADFADIKDGGLLDSIGDKANDKSMVSTAPKVKRRSPIIYPELARRQGISGYVTMNVLIDESGNVEDVQIIDSKPEEIFDLKADATIRSWKFEPATYNGKAVRVWAMQKIVFKLD